MKSLSINIPKLTLVYLVFPLQLFLLLWFQWWLCVPLTFLFTAALVKSLKLKHEQDFTLEFRFAAVVALFALVMTAAAGIGGLSFQNSDYWKHNTVFYDLIVQDWPVRYSSCAHLGSIKGQGCGLVYYTGFYLPAAFLGKVAHSYVFGQYSLWLWASFGFFLVFSWLHILLKSKNALLPLVFLLFGGLDVLGFYWQNRLLPEMGGHFEWWASLFQYSSMSTVVLWVPQHALAAWLGAAFFLNGFRTKTLHSGALILCALVLWSPFVVMGLLPFYLLAFGLRKYPVTRLEILLGVVGAFALLPYFGSHVGGVPVGPLWIEPTFWWRYPLFVLLEFGGIALCLYRNCRHDRIFLLTLAVLLALPFYRVGAANDLVMRVSLPALFCLSIFTWQTMGDRAFRKTLRFSVICVLLALGALTPMSEWYRSFKASRQKLDAENFHMSVIQLPAGLLPQQYVGELDSFYYKYLAR